MNLWIITAIVVSTLWLLTGALWVVFYLQCVTRRCRKLGTRLRPFHVAVALLVLVLGPYGAWVLGLKTVLKDD